MEIVPLKYENEKLLILDQTLLPTTERWLTLETAEAVREAIRSLRIRGAPAIGVAAAYGFYVAVRDLNAADPEEFLRRAEQVKSCLETSRPTAVNLFTALARMEKCLKQISNERTNSGAAAVAALKAALREEALTIHQEDEAACRVMGEYGLSLLDPGMGILTHCNAGALAASRYGTALAPLHLGAERGYGFQVYADETRPLLQGARLTAWELMKSGTDVTLICDNMVSSVMKSGRIDAVLVGCDRMAMNGDGANKIGTSGVAILAGEYGIPFYMFVPVSTIDVDAPDGGAIPIEERDGSELCEMWYRRPMAPAGVRTFNPAFDVTDHEYITAIITEKGIVRPPFAQGLRRIISGPDPGTHAPRNL